MQMACHHSFSGKCGLQAKCLAAHGIAATIPLEVLIIQSDLSALLSACLLSWLSCCSHDQYVLREEAKSVKLLPSMLFSQHVSLDSW